jgi:Uma2 family endonuclease
MPSLGRLSAANSLRAMNTPLHTRAAEGWDRRAFTVEEVWAMTRAGIIDGDERFELWEGDLVPMSAKSSSHEIWKRRLNRILQRGLPDWIDAAVAPSLYLSDMTFLEPDILIHRWDILPGDVRGPDVLLAVEVSDSTLAKDLRPKARLYSKHGVAHYWVFDAENRRAHLMSEPGVEGYLQTRIVESSGEVTLPFEAALTIRLADLG